MSFGAESLIEGLQEVCLVHLCFEGFESHTSEQGGVLILGTSVFNVRSYGVVGVYCDNVLGIQEDES